MVQRAAVMHWVVSSAGTRVPTGSKQARCLPSSVCIVWRRRKMHLPVRSYKSYPASSSRPRLLLSTVSILHSLECFWLQGMAGLPSQVPFWGTPTCSNMVYSVSEMPKFSWQYRITLRDHPDSRVPLSFQGNCVAASPKPGSIPLSLLKVFLRFGPINPQHSDLPFSECTILSGSVVFTRWHRSTFQVLQDEQSRNEHICIMPPLFLNWQVTRYILVDCLINIFLLLGGTRTLPSGTLVHTFGHQPMALYAILNLSALLTTPAFGAWCSCTGTRFFCNSHTVSMRLQVHDSTGAVKDRRAVVSGNSGKSLVQSGGKKQTP